MYLLNPAELKANYELLRTTLSHPECLLRSITHQPCEAAMEAFSRDRLRLHPTRSPSIQVATCSDHPLKDFLRVISITLFREVNMSLLES